ncbi:protein FAM185A-like [Orbicella faveolata]|uniref:protein FAM185A-like n=1 Tax=Orbicella faveolata TaxID=48498 RepID=UPI0009E57149|nr:protein FAM185A-like [Orbicella faveolata]
MLHNLVRKFKPFRTLKGGRLSQDVLIEAIRLNRSQIRLKSHDMATWRISAARRGAPGISVKSPYSVKIEAINPMEYVEHGDPKAEMVKGYLYLQTVGEEDLPLQVKTAFQEDIEYCVQSESSSSRDYLKVTCSDQREFQYPSKDVSLHFQVPANYGADIKVRDDANVDIRNLEGGPFDIIMDQGTCRVKNLRGSHLRVKTNGGSIECESQLLFELGNLDTKKKGKISVKKLQGKEFCLETENGAIDVGASYVLKAQLSSESGHINLGDIHGESEVSVKSGDISIGSTSGILKAVTNTGNIDISLSRHNNVILETKEGDIHIKSLEESLYSELQVKSKHIDINSNVNVAIDKEEKGENFIVMSGKLNPEDKTDEETRTIKAEAKLGTVKIEKKDWFSSLKFS